MAKPSFVGYQEKVEIPADFKLLEVHEVLFHALNGDQLFSYLSDPLLISQWLFPVEKIDLRLGGKIKYLEDDGKTSEAICTSITFGREVSILTHKYGEVKGSIAKSTSGGSLELHFKILTGDEPTKRTVITDAISRLKALIA